MLPAGFILPSLCPQTIAFLQEKESSASCRFQICTFQPYEDWKSMEAKLEESPFFLIKIIQGFVVHISTISHQLTSGLRPSLQYKFQILKKKVLGEETVVGLAFQGPSISKRLILASAEKQQLIHFITVLKGLSVIELGFSKQRFEPIRRIGEGANAKVYEAIDTQSKKRVAIRSFKKKSVSHNGNFKKSFLTEVDVMKNLKGQGFSQFIGVYESEHSIYMVMQLFSRNLKAQILRYGFPQFPQCKLFMLRLAQAINFLHQHDIMHRDIKLQNVMIRDEGPDPNSPVLVDFGLAVRGDASAYDSVQGTPGYIAPEIFSRTGYTKNCDVFSLGVLFHFILLGQMVFLGNNEREVMILNRSGEIDYFFSRHPMIPEDMRSLLGGMLQKSPERRLNIRAVLDHPFFQDV